MALINAYIIYRRVQAARAPGKAPPTHAEYMRLMQVALLSVGAADFEGDLSVRGLADTPVPPSPTPRYTLPGGHTTRQVKIYRITRGKNGKETRKRRRYGCKVCSLLRPGKNPWETIFYCVECAEAKTEGGVVDTTNSKGKIYPCQKVRQHDPSASTISATCSTIWRDLWRRGTAFPQVSRSSGCVLHPGVTFSAPIVQLTARMIVTAVRVSDLYEARIVISSDLSDCVTDTAVR
ncbi:hypothetical protein L914_13117 [Phytophthora nicotianae]|uniref:PiggyBac transposable element-derived protein 4 C-terminal zinc-ribbon domain-containing protein n=1 Tax=Phytophthora nicotianae TaxID=4792 RepID=W2MXS4_PHYNI|nr:hypothetical protein L914_13117 [Phytophthora nicotianae]